MAGIYANLLEQKKTFPYEKSSTPTGLVWDTNMAAVTSCENTPTADEFPVVANTRTKSLQKQIK